jgi:hypothetical protein
MRLCYPVNMDCGGCDAHCARRIALFSTSTFSCILVLFASTHASRICVVNTQISSISTCDPCIRVLAWYCKWWSGRPTDFRFGIPMLLAPRHESGCPCDSSLVPWNHPCDKQSGRLRASTSSLDRRMVPNAAAPAPAPAPWCAQDFKSSRRLSAAGSCVRSTLICS